MERRDLLFFCIYKRSHGCSIACPIRLMRASRNSVQPPTSVLFAGLASCRSPVSDRVHQAVLTPILRSVENRRRRRIVPDKVDNMHCDASNAKYFPKETFRDYVSDLNDTLPARRESSWRVTR